MKLKMKLKKRWFTAVLAEAEALSEPMPWQRKRQEAKSRQRGTEYPGKPRLVRA